MPRAGTGSVSTDTVSRCWAKSAFRGASRSWQNETVKYTNKHGCIVSARTGNVVPQLHCSVWEKAPGESCWHSHGLGKFHVFRDKAFPKRMMNRLCGVTELVTDELVCEMLPEREREEFRQKIQERNGDE